MAKAVPIDGTRSSVYRRFYESQMFARWHWFRLHFRRYKDSLTSSEDPFAESIVDAILDCESTIPGCGASYVDAIAQLSGSKDDRKDLDQLYQILAELLVVRQALKFEGWPPGTSFEHEPTISKGGVNPEVVIRAPDFEVGLEVKAPSLRKHQQDRQRNVMEVVARSEAGADFMRRQKATNVDVTQPRDNPMKDFLESADRKFSPFKKVSEKPFVGLLAVVWDDFVAEPISALRYEESGLFTANSFAHDQEGTPLQFAAVDGVVIIRHLHQLAAAHRGVDLGDDCAHALDYGIPGGYPPKAFIANPRSAMAVPELACDALQAIEADPAVDGAEYHPQPFIAWGRSLVGQAQGTAPRDDFAGDLDYWRKAKDQASRGSYLPGRVLRDLRRLDRDGSAD